MFQPRNVLVLALETLKRSLQTSRPVFNTARQLTGVRDSGILNAHYPGTSYHPTPMLTELTGGCEYNTDPAKLFILGTNPLAPEIFVHSQHRCHQ